MIMNNTDNETQLTIRCSADMRRLAETHAATKGQSVAEWIRRAIQMQIDADDRRANAPSDEEQRIAAIVEKILKQKGI